MIYSAIGNWRGRLYLFFFGIGLVMLFLPWFFKGNPRMPGEALQEINKRYIVQQTPQIGIVAAHKNLADAAAWEFNRSDITFNIPGNKVPVYLIKFADSRPSDAIFTKDGIALHKYTTSPFEQLIKDLTN